MNAWSPEDAQAIAEAAASSGDATAQEGLRGHFTDRPGWVYARACAEVDRLRAREGIALDGGGTLQRVHEQGRP